MTKEANKLNIREMTDVAIVKLICQNLKTMRLHKNITQDQLSELAGLGRITINRFETGKGANLLTFIQILRVLDKLDLLNVLFEQKQSSPIMMLKNNKTERKNASGKRKKLENKPELEW